MAAYLGVIIDTCILKGTLGYTHEILEIMAIVPAAMWVFYLAIQTFTTLKKDRETRLSKVRDQSHGRMPSVQPSNPETATEASSYPSRRDTCHLQLSDSLERLKEKEDKLAQLRYDLELMQLEVDRASEHSAEIKTQLGMMDALRFLGWESDLDTRSADVESLGEV
ncbi:hypothetical protein BJ508DRAFT_330319 [Ascobolus immersus RN42]|uniref:Uncharacterized protein n=1 Tax=Ascobolus immersus RN42 TaxID=1160509 RepID=A0A3N4HZN6_ASCIM|nr:hypothetical protein BJ508DRAFT_330319 [Ascobolus immersus RN42]